MAKDIKQVTGSSGGILPVFVQTYVTETAATQAVYEAPRDPPTTH